MNNKIFHGILIPCQGAPKLISLTLGEIETTLNQCERAIGYTAEYLDCFGYHITIFSADLTSNIISPRNGLASIITKESGSIFGNAILIDDNKDLTIEDFRKIIEIAQVIPSCTWISEPEIQAISEDNTLSDGFVDDIIRNSGSEINRNKIWNKIGKYYIPQE